ncbi:glycosyltransferase [Mobilicoccus massiliensis]|uniref:glycosyltransferase n=1 Tax=Mobilicoccus massiliensis TaxID=1522310 RepID=UPI000B23F0C1|nr:glycosyltransferase [Mobilicoccus massiliensis]
MRLAVLGPTWHHLGEPFAGGQESMVAGLVGGLRERGHHVLLYAREGTPTGLADRLLTYPDLPAMSRAARDDLGDDPRALRDLADQHAYAWATGDLVQRTGVDLILNHSFSPLPLAFGHTLSAPVLTTLHTPPLPGMEIGAALAVRAARYVAVSAHTARAWTTLPDVAVVPNGVDEQRFRPGPGGDGLVWVGRITPEKGLPVALRAARHAGLPLTIVGPVSDAGHYERDVRPLMDDTVRHLGHLSQAQIRDVLARSDSALVTPRWEEPFGLVAAEAMMCGTPVVALDRGGVREVVGDEGGVLVADRDGDDDAAARALAAAVPRALRMDRGRVRADAVARLSATAMIERYLEIIDAMMARPGHVVERARMPHAHLPRRGITPDRGSSPAPR